METNSFDSLQCNFGEHRLIYFGLEAPTPQNQPEAQNDKPKKSIDSREPIEEAEKHATQRKEAEAKDARKDQRELVKIEKEIEEEGNAAVEKNAKGQEEYYAKQTDDFMHGQLLQYKDDLPSIVDRWLEDAQSRLDNANKNLDQEEMKVAREQIVGAKGSKLAIQRELARREEAKK